MNDKENLNNIPPADKRDAIAVRRRSKNYDAADVLCFLIPAVQFIRVEIVGVLSAADVLLILLFIYLLFRGGIRVTTREGKTFLVLCSLWLAGQILADVVRHSAFTDLIRGWSNIGLTIVNFCALFPFMYRNRRRLELFGWGMVAGRLAVTLVNPDNLMQAEPWKFGYSFPVTWAIFLIASGRMRHGRSPIALGIFAGVLNIVLGHRSLGGFCLATVAYLSMARPMQKPGRETPRMKTASRIAIVVSLIAVSACTSWLYSYEAESGALGDRARSKYEEQSSGKYGLLLGGRTESLAYLPAIYDSPILGHGSWAKDPLYITLQLRTLALLGYTSSESESSDSYRLGLIPTHSFLFGAWVDAGILGAVFWAWLWILAVRLLFQNHSRETPFLPLISFVAFQLLWDIFFSPYGGENRVVVAYYVVLVFSCIKPAIPKRVPLKTKHLKRQVIGRTRNPITA